MPRWRWPRTVNIALLLSCYNLGVREVQNAQASNCERLDHRETDVLRGLMATYLASGSPVGSRALTELRPGSPSSATIRHVLAVLEQGGYLIQPHVSAGRIPTAKAICWWLQQLDAPTPLNTGVQAERLERELRAANDEATVWQRASEFLSEVTRQIGVVAVQPWRDSGLRQLRFYRLTDQRVLAILVATDGQVRERVCRVPESYSQAELDAAARYFNCNFAGSTLMRIRRELLRRIEEERAAYDQLLKRVVVLIHSGVLAMQDSGEVYVEGAPHLAAVLDGEQLGRMLARLNQKEQWLDLLMRVSGKEETGEANLVEWDSGAATAGPRHWVRVKVGLEQEQLPGFSLITTNHPQGALGILGSTRMEYERALGAVALVRDMFERVLGKGTS